MSMTLDNKRDIPRLSLNRNEVAYSLGVSASTVDVMVAEGFLPRPRRWHSRKLWLVSDIVALQAVWPEDGIPENRGDADDSENWQASL